jgi:hypothetical protein
MFLLILLAVVIAVLWKVAMVDRAALDEIRSRIDRELAAMEAVDRLFEARDRARQEMRRVASRNPADRSPFDDQGS